MVLCRLCAVHRGQRLAGGVASQSDRTGCGHTGGQYLHLPSAGCHFARAGTNCTARAASASRLVFVGFGGACKSGLRHRFDLGLDSKLRACDLVRLRVRDICHGDRVSTCAIVMQQKTAPTRDAATEWIKKAELANDDDLFPSRVHDSPHLGTRQYARILDSWIEEIGLDPTAYGTHTMRRTKASLIYRRTKNIRAVQLLLGHTKLESTVRYLGIEVEDALELAEQTEI